MVDAFREPFLIFLLKVCELHPAYLDASDIPIQFSCLGLPIINDFINKLQCNTNIIECDISEPTYKKLEEKRTEINHNIDTFIADLHTPQNHGISAQNVGVYIWNFLLFIFDFWDQ